MNTIDSLISQITSKKTIEEQKKIAAKEIKAFVRRTNPYKGLKVSNFYLYIDTKARTYAIILRGVKPNAGYDRRYNAPIEKREKMPKPEPVKFAWGWRMVDTKRKTSNSQGIQPLDIGYYGVSGKPDQFFGLRRKGKIQAFGLIDDAAVPIYSQDGFVEWLTVDNAEELERICIESGFEAIEKGV